MKKEPKGTSYALELQQLVKNDWRNESAATINVKCNEIFTRILTKELKDFALKRQVKHTSIVIERSIPIHTLNKLVDAEQNTNEKNRNLDLRLEINNVPSKLESQSFFAETCDPNPAVIFTQTTVPNKKSKPPFRNYCNYCHKPNQYFSSCFRKQRKDEERKPNSYCRS